MSIVYLVPGNMTGGPYGLKELKRREKLLKDWSFNPSKVKVSKYSWQRPHSENKTGTEKAYRPNKIINKKKDFKKYESWKIEQA